MKIEISKSLMLRILAALERRDENWQFDSFDMRDANYLRGQWDKEANSIAFAKRHWDETKHLVIGAKVFVKINNGWRTGTIKAYHTYGDLMVDVKGYSLPLQFDPNEVKLKEKAK